ncbi:hypothetical protein [Actinosynnema sp. NPDC023587]|uniref:tetratricopeptide repeat protein n=1 Tax=Actinosynnema sp. NPDC023587 TaxID=3154695 RepID=UPI0033CDF41B
MTSRNRVPNDQLRALLREARWTNHNFSLAVNRVAAEAGYALHYDRTSVSHWLSGSRPRPPVPEFVAEALGRRLGRPVPSAATGMVDASAEHVVPAPDPGAGLPALRRLLAVDLDPCRRVALFDQPFRADWSAVPPWRHRSGGPGRHREGTPEDGLGMTLAVMTSAFATADEAFGGGHARSALATFLADDVLGWLRSPSGRVREQLFSGTAALIHLIGSMCFDDFHHRLAQHYFRIALLLFGEVGDGIGHALVLRAMSTQAYFLGHHRLAAQLADTAASRGGTSMPPGSHAVLLAQAAVAHAALSDRATALARLAEAERRVEKTDDVRQPGACTDRADVEHLVGQALALLHDHRRAENALCASLRHRPEGERRSRLLTTHRLAELQLRRDKPEQACVTWQRFLDECSWVRSGQVRSAQRSFRRSLQPYRGNAAVRRVLWRAAARPPGKSS